MSSPSPPETRSRRIGLWLAVGGALLLVTGFVVGRGGAREAISMGLQWRFDGIEHLSVDTVRNRLNHPSPPLLLDVRSHAEYVAGHLAGARWLDPGADPKTALADIPRGRSVIAYCSVGWRSSSMAERLQSAGFTQVANLRGGAFEWVSRGQSVVDETGPGRRVHGFGAPWSWLLSPEHRSRP